MPKQRRSKSLEKVARAIKDSDDFVNHVFGIAAGYRAQHALEAGAAGQPVRQALKTFAKHAEALDAWLRDAQRSAAPETEALKILSTAAHGSAGAARAQAAATQLWLAQLNKATDRALDTLKRSPQRLAPRRAAEALRATFEHHDLKVTYRTKGPEPSDAIRLFCAIARDSDDAEMTPDIARDHLRSASVAKVSVANG